MSKRKRLLLGVTVLLLIAFASAVNFSDNHPDTRRARLQNIDLPPDGLALYHTLMQEIPEVVSQVPCACCDEMLSACYQGACPPS